MEFFRLKYLVYGLAVVVMVLAVVDTGISKASSSSAKQTVTITIPPIRALYINDNDVIIAIFSNTSFIAKERVQVFEGGVERVVNDNIRRKYEELEPKIDWSRIGWVYWRSGLGPKSHRKSEGKGAS